MAKAKKSKKSYPKKSQQDIKSEIFASVTNQILAEMEQGSIPWHKPWNYKGQMPTSLSTGKAYRGINVWILGAQPYGDPRWGTYKAISDLDGQVRKDEKSSKVILIKPRVFKGEDSETGEETTKFGGFIFRTFAVFNAEQADWSEPLPSLEAQETDNANDTISECEAIIRDFPQPPKIVEGNDGRCWYAPSLDKISMAPLKSFNDSESFYGTLFHELAHSTGSTKRIGRLKGSKALAAFGSADYGYEELVAELASALVSGVVGILPAQPTNCVAYLQNWKRVIKADNTVFLRAAQEAQRAADWILNDRQDRDK